MEPVIRTKTHATLEEILAMADRIYNQVKHSGIDIRDTRAVDDYAKVLREQNLDFAKTYPVVFNWIVLLREYSSKAFTKYIMKNSTNQWDTRKDYIMSHADYLVNLCKDLHPKKYDSAQLREYREQITKKLLEEDAEFDKNYKAAEAEVAAAEDRRQRARLYTLLTGKQLSSAPTASAPASTSNPASAPASVPASASASESKANPVESRAHRRAAERKAKKAEARGR